MELQPFLPAIGSILTTTGLAVAGTFLAAILCGILAGIVAYGFLDSFRRASIQFNVVSAFVRKTIRSGPAEAYIDRRYGARSPLPLEPGDSPDDRSHFVKRYTSQLLGITTFARSPLQKGLAIYRLHHSLLAGQIMSRINAESRSVDGDDRATPLLDLFAIAGETSSDMGWEEDGWSATAAGPRSTARWTPRPGPAAPAQVPTAGFYIESAVVGLDALQAELGESIRRAGYLYCVWTCYLLLSIVFLISYEQFNLYAPKIQTSGIVLTSFYFGLATWLLFLWACGTIIANLLFSWLDRVGTRR